MGRIIGYRYVEWYDITMISVKRVSSFLLVAFVPLLLISSSARFVINFPPFYNYAFERHQIAEYTGIHNDELRVIGERIRKYFNNKEKDLVIKTFTNGVLKESLFNEKEIIHMEDVKHLVRLLYLVNEISAVYILSFAGVALYFGGLKYRVKLTNFLRRGTLVTFISILFTGLLVAFSFNRLFLIFHIVSFSNDFWQLDPRQDYLIAIFPQGFFFEATLLIAVISLVASFVLWLLSKLLSNSLQS